MALRLITAPAETPVTLTEAKAHLRVVDDDDDAFIEILIPASTRHAERFMGRAIIDQTWELVLDAFPTCEIKIPLPPLIEVVSVVYDDEDGNEQTLSTSGYTVDNVSEPGWVVPTDDTWPTTFDGINAVRIRFRAGYLDTLSSPQVANVPDDIRFGILLNIGSMFANRETVVIGVTATTLPWGAEQLLRAHRVDLSFS